MAALAASNLASLPSSLQKTAQSSVVSIPETFPEPQTIEELLLQRCVDDCADKHVVAYPSSGTEFVYYTPKQLNALVEKAVSGLSSFITFRRHSDEPVQTIGLLGVSTLEYLITMMALARMGHTVLYLSTRISEEAYVSLLQKTNSSTIIIDSNFSKMMENVKTQIPELNVLEFFKMDEIQSFPSAHMVHQRQSSREAQNIIWIIHSSGSTGLPKPIFQTNRAAVRNYSNGLGLDGFICLPLFHAHGISSLFRGIYSKNLTYLYSATLPLTKEHLIATLKHEEIRIFYSVPYALKLLSESEEGVRLLASLDIVMFGGSACPKPIGDKLTKQGVFLVSHYGSTETGQLMTSFRPRDDPDWDFVRPPENLKPFMRWEEKYPGIFELSVLDGWPSKVATNREDGSYATKDLFEKHPTTPNAYRYYARLDDTITLVNGEKANPLLVEGVAREQPLVAEAVQFGAGKPYTGLFVIPAEKAESNDQVIQALWPAIEATNERVPAYARLSKEMIICLPKDAEYRKTDKGTVIRAAFYKQYAEQIDAAYEESLSGTLVLQKGELLGWLREQLLTILRLPDAEALTDDTDLFSLGMDSLQATQFRQVILRELDLGGNPPGQNFAFDFPTLKAMETELLRMRSGEAAETVSVEQRMQEMIDRHGVFEPHTPQENVNEGEYVIVTGATGSLGAHTAAILAKQDNVRAVYCLVRASSEKSAQDRVRQSLQERRLYHTLSFAARKKIISLPSKLHEDRLGLTEERYNEVTANLTSVIHCAWSVNFNLSLESFEKDCIVGAKNLIQTCLNARRPAPASFNFCSSVSAVVRTPSGVAPEALPASLSYAQEMGYAQSKLVTEHICVKATAQTRIKARVLRVGQIIGDTKFGVWNATEAIPMIFQTAKTVGALPKLEENPAWLPVDKVAMSTVEISLSGTPGGQVVNLVNHETFHWTKDLLPLLHSCGLGDFDEVSQKEWVTRLRNSNSDPVANPPYKLLEFFAKKYDTDKPRSSLLFNTQLARDLSPTLRNVGVINKESVANFIKYLDGSCWQSNTKSTKNVVIIAGPCGTGKSTVAQHISSKLNIPMIEGDELHSPDAIAKMGRGEQLLDEERWSWLERIRNTVVEKLSSKDTNSVTVTCSALRACLRDKLRQMEETTLDGAKIRVTFVLLWPDAETSGQDANALKERLRRRQGHYMKEDMVEAQLEMCQWPQDEEVDIIPVNSLTDATSLCEEVEGIVGEIIKA